MHYLGAVFHSTFYIPDAYYVYTVRSSLYTYKWGREAVSDTQPHHTLFSESEDSDVFYYKYWRVFDSEDKIHHESMNPFFHDYDLGTWLISSMEPREKKLLASKLARIQANVRRKSYHDNVLMRILRLISSACAIYNIDNSTCELAAKLAHKIYTNAYKGREPVKAAIAMYSALTSGCYPLTTIRNVMAYLLGEWTPSKEHLVRYYAKKSGLPMKCSNPRLLIARIINEAARKLKLDEKSITLAERIASVFYAYTNPRSLAAAAIYMALKLLDKPTRQTDIASAVGISDASLRNALKKMNPTIEYYVCSDRPRGTCILLYTWQYGKNTVGIRSAFEFAAHIGAKKYTYDFEVGKPIKIWIVPRDKK